MLLWLQESVHAQMEPIYLTMHVFLVIIPAKHAPVVRTMIVYYANLSIFELLSVQFANVI